ncbi:MAG: SUF system Fe-S cluster assembly regulator [Deltaproteobacteria bacterium]|nr:SUF system Fe-S cluster assembly regulator [Deltaproteobacteria bacterium]
MLRVTKLTDYAIVVASALARDPRAFHRASEVAQAAAVPEPTVRKVLRLLVQGEVAQSTRGVKGGYRLSRAPREIDLAQIVAAVEGPIAMTDCCTEDVGCEQESGCQLRPNWQMINDAIQSALASINLEQMNAPLPAGLVGLGRAQG